MSQKFVDVEELASALYEGRTSLQQLGAALARQYGEGGKPLWYKQTAECEKGFWRSIAQQLVDHAMPESTEVRDGK